MNRHRIAAIVGGTALLASVPLVARADTPAPAGEAEAVAAQVGSIAAVGHTHAKADQTSGEATANAVELGGSPPASQFGGTQKGKGHSSGSLFDSGSTPLGRARLTPWDANVDESDASRDSVADAALARLVLGDNVASLDLLRSHSEAHHTGMTSSGSASSDGAVANVGGDSGLTVVVLHSEASSSGTGKSYVLGLNDTQILTSDQANGQCAIAVPQLISVNCLSVTGGAGSVTATVASVLVGDQNASNLPANVVAASGRGQSQAAPAPAATPAAAPAPAPAPAVAGREKTFAASGTLARTGTDAWFAALVGMALLALGWSVMGLGREWVAARS